ncbi:MAG TPA: hypothetical protein VMV44_08095 [Rectinemataceae bacterium]|nr:hypothetical protein [Rectinemataceae bacterium]
MGGRDGGGAGDFGDFLILKTDLVMAERDISPLEIARARRAGRIELAGPPDGDLSLEVGGRAIATGRIVKRGGRHFFKVQGLFDKAEEARR